MRRGPDGRKSLCNACGLFWKRTGKLKDLSTGQINLSIDQSVLGRLLPKFSEWDVEDPSSAEGFTVIFNETGDEKKTGENPESPGNIATEPHNKPALDPGKPQSPMKSFTFSETPVTIESLLEFLDKDVPSTSEVDHALVVGISR